MGIKEERIHSTLVGGKQKWWSHFLLYLKGYRYNKNTELYHYEKGMQGAISYYRYPYYDQYVIQYHNAADKTKKCVLLGGNLFLLKENHGSEIGVNVYNHLGSDYSHLITYLMGKKIILGGMRIESNNLQNLQQIMKHIHSHANGNTKTTPIEISKFKKEGQFVEDIIDIDRQFTFTGDSYFEFTIEPNSAITFSLFPKLIE